MTSAQSPSPDDRLKHAVQVKDVELVRDLLESGAGPDCIESSGDSLLHYLAHEYQVVRSTQGPAVIEILELLLAHGANPEHIGANNWRAIDVCIEQGVPALIEVFVRHGTNPSPREFA